MKYRSHCPINFAQETFGDKWSLLVMRDLIFKDKKYYNEFLASDEKISTNILADRLSKLEMNGLIIKSTDKENQAKKRYSLTNKGLDLLPMLLEMIAWSAKYDSQTEAPDTFIQSLKSNRQALIEKLTADLGDITA
ncbi:winged helix-turn-helix transcriptional regulator [Paraglaciecola sp.]|uniref:winged helix-turn-helix transcriptional regulator n=1 Tax=Paraglaciecola sp. TaxID=1920173 RepID=UPI003EF88242